MDRLPFETDLSRLEGDSPQWYLDGYPLFYLPQGRVRKGPVKPPALAPFIDGKGRTKAATAYFHIPFCRGLCRFCMIKRRPQQEKLIPAFLGAIHREMELARASRLADDLEFGAVAMGGGTPTCLEASDLLGLVDGLRRSFNCRGDMACCLEASTHTARDPGKLEALIQGFSRISFGVQTFDDKLRRAFGMADSGQKAEESVRLARGAGFENINIDLMYGLPGQDAAHLAMDLSRALELGLESYTVYPLVVYPSSALARGRKALPPQPTGNDLGGLLELTARTMEKAGYRRFWVYQYIREDLYRPPAALNLDSYLAFGPGAFGTMQRFTYYNQPELKKYIDYIAKGRLPYQRLCPMDEEHWGLRKFIFLFLQFRVEWQYFSERERSLLENLLLGFNDQGLFLRDKDGVTPTTLGLRHADAFLRELARLSGQGSAKAA